MTKNVTYVNNAINAGDLKRSLEKKNHPFTVFTLGRICCQKNPRLLNFIVEKMPDTKFLRIGDGKLRKEFRASNIEITR